MIMSFLVISFFIVVLIIMGNASGSQKNNQQNPPVHNPRYPSSYRPKSRSSSFNKEIWFKPPTEHQIASFNLNQRIYGQPGKSLQDSGFSDKSVNSGIIGEQKTAAIIAKFIAETSETYAFHSLRWPMSSTNADVDHAIVCGDHVLFIDSKNWREKGVYFFNWEGDIALNGEVHRYGREPRIIPAREKYEDYLAEIFGTYRSTVVSSVITIHSPGSSIGPSSFGTFNHLTTGDSLLAFLNKWRLGVGIVENNRKLLASILTCLK